MKIAVFAVGAAIIATQIGCTWWLSRQPAHLDGYHETAIEATNVAIRPLQCHVTELKYMLIAQSHGQPLEAYVQNTGPCD